MVLPEPAFCIKIAYDDDVVFRLVSPPTEAPVRAQQPVDPNPLGDEESTVPFESDRALA